MSKEMSPGQEAELEARLAEIVGKDACAMSIDLSDLSSDELTAHYLRAKDENNSLYEALVREELKKQHNTVIWP